MNWVRKKPQIDGIYWMLTKWREKKEIDGKIIYDKFEVWHLVIIKNKMVKEIRPPGKSGYDNEELSEICSEWFDQVENVHFYTYWYGPMDFINLYGIERR